MSARTPKVAPGQPSRRKRTARAAFEHARRSPGTPKLASKPHTRRETPRAAAGAAQSSRAGLSSDGSRDGGAWTQRVTDQARAARRRAAEVPTASADLADAHAERAQAQGDPERAAFERDTARRVRAGPVRLTDSAP